MPNKTIYVSEQDVTLFEEAKSIAGEALSSVIAIALREYVHKHQKASEGFKEVSLMVGKPGVEREKRFTGALAGKWQGFSDDKEWWMSAMIYQTQKNNWAVNLVTICKASLLTNRKAWKEHGDYLTDVRRSDLIVGATLAGFEGKVPSDLLATLQSLMEKDQTPVEYLDI